MPALDAYSAEYGTRILRVLVRRRRTRLGRERKIRRPDDEDEEEKKEEEEEGDPRGLLPS